MEIYQKRRNLFELKYQALRRNYKLVGAARILAFLAMVYFFYLSMRHENYNYLYVSIGLVVVFIILLRFHGMLSWSMRFQQALRDINADEEAFIHQDIRNFDDGKSFEVADHPYSFDLDIFGPRSLFQYLNRTASYVGQSKLAELLNTPLKAVQITENQDAIKELSQKVEWRQEIFAYSKIAAVDKATYEHLKRWSGATVTALSKVSLAVAYILPALLLGTIVAYFVVDHFIWGYLISLLFSFNLIASFFNMKRIQEEIGGADKIHETINNYALILKKVEKEPFVSAKMKAYLAVFKQDDFQASKAFKELSEHFEKLYTVANLFVNIAFNGLFQYHVHALHKLLVWKAKNGSKVSAVVDCIGELEALNSIANFSYNNRSYTFPVFSTERKMQFKDLGHPLIAAIKRVCNDIDFSEQRFVILTGSNMSGKSTFLRTVGINLVLAGIGAPICASKASFFPMPIYVSMRLTDSLEDSESYFYAEVKRLKLIMEEAHRQPSFVLLDEILRGTNSDDKQSGTIGVILKLIQEQTFGVIATHDLEVCAITAQHPQILMNKCFEVEIQDDDLRFDYKIRPGVCQNKNATFIMKKMQIID